MEVVGLATRWVAALAPLGGPPATSENLTELAGRLALSAGTGIRDPDQAAKIGRQIGRQLAEANLTSPDAVGRAVIALGDHWLGRRPDPPSEGVDPACVTAMQGGLAAGHAAAVQRRLLAQQEAIHRATVAARNAAEQRLRHEANHDNLTGLANRMLFLDRLKAALAAPGPTDHVAVCLLDLDQFSTVNTAHGHLNGDLVLRAVAGRLAAALEGSPTLLARLDGDEFAALLSGAEPLGARNLDTRLLESLRQPVRLDGRPPVLVRASAAVVQLPAAQTDANAVLRAAELALRTVKDPGPSHLTVYRPRSLPAGSHSGGGAPAFPEARG
jgi:diguanylate cyclase (GGDEF)-like protein